MTKEEIVDIADFFTTSNEKEGVWFEPEIRGKKLGIEFKILGSASDENIKSADIYNKEHEQAEKETDPLKKVTKEREAVCKRIASIITDMRPAAGKKIVVKGEPLTYSPEMIQKILWENIEIRTALFSPSIDDANFMTKKD